jgi:hypothetical protein
MRVSSAGSSLTPSTATGTAPWPPAWPAQRETLKRLEVVFRETIPSWRHELAEVRAGTATIVAGYRNRLAELLGVMATELEPWKDRLDTLADTVKGTIEEMAEDVFARPARTGDRRGRRRLAVPVGAMLARPARRLPGQPGSAPQARPPPSTGR